MTIKNRQEKIKELVQSEMKVRVSDLSERFNVTSETIRRDLEMLEKEGFVSRTYGGAVLREPADSTEHFPYMERTNLNAAEKTLIAQELVRANLIPPYASILSDSSSTVFRVLQMLHDRDDLTLVVNSLRIVPELGRTKLNVVLTGGNVNMRTFSLEGPFATSAVMRSHVDVVLVSCLGLTLDEGVFDSYSTDADLKKLMIKQGKFKILLADHTKFNRKAIIKLWNLDEIDAFVTDRKPSEEWMELFRRNGVRVYYPGFSEP